MLICVEIGEGIKYVKRGDQNSIYFTHSLREVLC